MRNMWPGQLYRRSLVFIRMLGDDVQASSAILCPVIFESILDTVLFTVFSDAHELYVPGFASVE